MVSTETVLWEWDLTKVTVQDVDFAQEFTVEFTKNSVAHSMLIYFDTPFPHDSALLCTGPTSRQTHWKQCGFFLDAPVIAVEGNMFSGRFAMRKSAKNPRDLDVKIDCEFEADGTVVAHTKVFRIR